MIYKLFRIDHTLIQPYGSRTAMFYSKKLQRIWKPPYIYFQTCWDFTIRLGSKSESWETKNWKSVKEYVKGFRICIFRMEKTQRVQKPI